MNFLLFFIPLLATISSLPLALNNVANADPNKIQDLNDFVDQLVAEGEAEEADFTKIRDDAQGALDVANSLLANADAALESAKAVNSAAIAKEAEKSADEIAKGQDRQTKLDIKKGKRSVLNAAINTDKTEQARLDKEKTLFQKVKGLLRSVKAEGRRLLSADSVNQALSLLDITSDADPTQVNEAIALLDDLIEAGEVERQGVIDALNKAQHEFDEASDIHADAVAVHTLAEGALASAQLEHQDAEKVLALRTDEQASADGVQVDAVNDLSVKQETLDRESARIASEKLDLEMIRDLLAKL